MGQEFVVGALALALTFFPLNPTQSAQLQNPHLETVKPQVREISVKSGETLSLIAEREYESKDYWTNIWNDNLWINDPNYIEKNWKLKINSNKPGKPADLKPELAKKLESQRRLAYVSESIVRSSTNPNPPQAYASSGSGPLSEGQINFLGSCESGMTATRNSGNGYFGAFQFSPGTWKSMGTVYERADLAPLDVQIDATQRLLQRSSIYTQFPGCAARMRTAGLL